MKKNRTTITSIEQCSTNGERLWFLLNNNPQNKIFTQAELAEEVGCSSQHINNFINGNRKANLSPGLAVEIAKALGVKVEDFMADFYNDEEIIKNQWSAEYLYKIYHVKYLNSIGVDIKEDIDKAGTKYYSVKTPKTTLLLTEKQLKRFFNHIDNTVKYSIDNMLYMDNLCRDLFPNDPEIII